jgi:hypothetical protein
MRIMNKHFQLSILLSCAGTLAASLLLSAPAAHAQCFDKQGAAYSYCMEQERKSDNTARDRRQQEAKDLDRRIQETRPKFGSGGGESSGGSSGGGDGFAGILGLLLTSPSIISGNGGIGYGAQLKFPIAEKFDVRGGLYFQEKSTPLNLGLTYRFMDLGMVRPFIGSGWRTYWTGQSENSIYGTAGVDIPFGGGIGMTAQANQGLIGGGFTEIQGSIGLFGF